MKVLWICNLALPEAAEQLKIEASNKEGWVSGLLHALLAHEKSAGIELEVAFPISPSQAGETKGVRQGSMKISDRSVTYYGFLEDTANPENFDSALVERMRTLMELSRPDIVHCFGTEYPHALAACMALPEKASMLLGIQGLCSEIAGAYYADLPEKVIKAKTFRDILRHDNIERQKNKFRDRGINEKMAIRMAENITGRTDWDKSCVQEIHPEAAYYFMNETLRDCFYQTRWEEANCVPHSLFMSQGDYPLKGLHYMLKALPGILEQYPDATLAIAGQSLVNYGTLKEKIKISAYGKYLRSLMKKYKLQDKVTFLGKLTGTQMAEQCLKSHTFVCCSALENSSNSLGEAMLLGMPIVCADVGGLPSMLHEGEGILFEGHRATQAPDLEGVAKRLQDAVIQMWQQADKRREYCEKARAHALQTHNGEVNCARLFEIYEHISEKRKNKCK